MLDIAKEDIDNLVGRHISTLIADMDDRKWYETIGRFEHECDILHKEGILIRGAMSEGKDYHRWKRVVPIVGR